MTRIRRLAKEGSWIVVGQIAAVLGSLVLVRVLTEHLDPTQYGQLALGLTVATLVNQVVMGGLAAGIGRFYSIAAEKQDLPSYLLASRRLMLYATLAVLALGLPLLIGLCWLGYSRWLGLAAAALLFSVLSGYNTTLSGIQNAARQRATVAFHGGLDAWLKILLALGLIAWLGNSSTVVVVGYALSSLLVTSSQLGFLRCLIPYKTLKQSGKSQWVRQIWQYSWPIVASGVFNWGYYSSQRWALEMYVSTKDVGKFFALTQIAYTPISTAGAMFLSFLIPILYAKVGDATNHGRLTTSHRIVKMLASVGLALTLALVIISYFAHGFVFNLLVASKFRDISSLMPHVVLAAGLLLVSQTLSSIIMVANKTLSLLPLNIFVNGSAVLMNLYFTRKWGIDGLVWAMVLGAFLHLACMTHIILRTTGKSTSHEV